MKQPQKCRAFRYVRSKVWCCCEDGKVRVYSPYNFTLEREFDAHPAW
jgi:hypothetical protein